MQTSEQLSLEKIKEEIHTMIINQDDNLKTELPQYVYRLLSAHLDDKVLITNISVEEALGFPAPELEELLKQKLCNSSGDSLVNKLNHIRTTEETFMENFMNLLARCFMIHRQEVLLHDKIGQLPRNLKKFLKEQVKQEKQSINKDLSRLQRDGDVINGGAAVHQVERYKDQETGGLFYVKNAEDQWYTKQFTGIASEAAREIAGSTFYQAMGLKNAAKVHKLDDGRIVSESVARQGEEGVPLDQFMRNQRGHNPSYKLDGALKQELMKAHAVAMLVGNRDAKDGNIMVVTDGEGKQRIAPIDFGHSFYDFAACKNAGAAGNNLSGAAASITASFMGVFGGFRLDTNTMRHRDSNQYFTQKEFQVVLTNTVNDFEKNKHEIFKQMYITCEALELSKAEIKTMMQTIKNNVNTAKMISRGERVKPRSYKHPKTQTSPRISR